MTITLAPEQLKWLESEVAAGSFSSVEDAVRLAIDDLMTAMNEDPAELNRLRQLIDEGDADVAAGRVHYYASAGELTADIIARGEDRRKKKAP